MASAKEIVETARKESRSVLTEMESKELLRSLGIPTTQMRLATSREEAVALSREVGFPSVLKVSSEDITHKSDAGGVKVGLADEAAVAQAYDDIMASCRAKFPNAVIEGVTVQDQARPGLEVIVGMATASSLEVANLIWVVGMPKLRSSSLDSISVRTDRDSLRAVSTISFALAMSYTFTRSGWSLSRSTTSCTVAGTRFMDLATPTSCSTSCAFDSASSLGRT